MELKLFQKDTITDLARFLDLIKETQNVFVAFETFWNERHVPVGLNDLLPYKNVITGVPHICFKVPTGGGKTFIACSAIKPIYDSLPPTKTKAVVWLVPSDSILEQTQKALCDPHHPYRQKIDVDFGSRVEVYTKQQLLNGQNFNPTSIIEQLSIFVLSYDSFRTSKKDGRKAFQENGNLAQFAKFFNDPRILLADTDETALIQVVRYLAPVVIVDESHHATSTLSVEMLQNFNPCFVLDLTATPKKGSNIISYVSAAQLKKESMVKLPVIVYNRKTQTDVFHDAISIRCKLEAQAKKEQVAGGRYIRPIVLFQAQSKGNVDNTTFQKVKHTLLDIDIPENQIAIKTADVNELKGIDLLAEDCPIRYIITVNALKEGWDCPFAYVLATIANRTSTIDVEQILGRVLRLPYTKKNKSDVLNIAYVLTSSNDFQQTLQKIVLGLNTAGFSDKDCYAPDVEERAQPLAVSPPSIQVGLSDTAQAPEDEYPDIDTAKIKERLGDQGGTDSGDLNIHDDALLAPALKESKDYEAELAKTGADDIENAPLEVREKMYIFRMNNEFSAQVSALRLPQFFVEAPAGLFSESEWMLVKPETLAEGFTLRGKDTYIDFGTLDTEMARVDIDDTKDAVPKAWKLTGHVSTFYKDWFNALPSEKRIQNSKYLIRKQLNKIDAINDRELKEYIDRVVETLNVDQLADLEQSPYPFAHKINLKICDLLAKHREKTFSLWVEQGSIICKPSYAFKNTISPTKFDSTLGKSLYTSEESMNEYERSVVFNIASLPNIKWWHRNMSLSGFNINGYVNAYPDIIAMTQKGNIIIVEPKGDHLDNDESDTKRKLGKIWERKAGNQYRYYMVFQTKETGKHGAYSFDKFMEIIKGL